MPSLRLQAKRIEEIDIAAVVFVKFESDLTPCVRRRLSLMLLKGVLAVELAIAWVAVKGHDVRRRIL